MAVNGIGMLIRWDRLGFDGEIDEKIEAAGENAATLVAHLIRGFLAWSKQKVFF